MTTYCPTSTGKKGIVTTAYSMGPGNVLCTESSVPGNMLYMNYSSSDNLVGISHSQSPHNAIELSASMADPQYNSWRDGRNELSFMQAVSVPTSNAMQNTVADDQQMSMGMQFNVLNGQNASLQRSGISVVPGQGLSLSLGTQIPASYASILESHQTSGNIESNREDNSREKHFLAYSDPYGLSTYTNTIPNSKYLNAAQQLLDEVVSVRKSLRSKLDKSQCLPNSVVNATDKGSEEGSKSEGVSTNPNESATNSTIELSPSERQDLQNKLTKLLAMLDEIDRRYKQYYNQMQIVVSSFDVIAGCEASKPYTALALQTISRHFRCLRDAINGQIQSTRKSLGEEDGSRRGGGISRLRYIDQHLKQQRAFQQFGIMPQHAWRPQRGLPENSVSILRAWLFEHFLHPYPKDSDKIMLARQTGLTRGQVSNWFINARVRLWKPMVEEMYKEEIGDGQMDSISSSENAQKGKDDLGQSEDKDHLLNMKSSNEKSQSTQFNESSKSVLPETEANGAFACIQTEENCNLLHDALVQTDNDGRFMSYEMAELGRYGHTGISLTLGLQHCQGGIPVSESDQHSFVSVRGDDMFNGAPLGAADGADYTYINLADSRHRFGSSQLLHDFVA